MFYVYRVVNNNEKTMRVSMTFTQTNGRTLHCNINNELINFHNYLNFLLY